MKRATQYVQRDHDDDPHKAASTPIYQTATFEQESAVAFGRFDYSRSGNPTREALEKRLAQLEYGTRGFAFASGIAAISAVVRLMSAGDEIVIGDDIYGGTYRLLMRIASRQGIGVRSADTTDVNQLVEALTDRTRLVLLETPSNPRQRVTELNRISNVLHERDVRLAVDNTFLSPHLQNPLAHGVDFVIHSATKHLGGHSDLTAGCVVVRDDELADELAFIQNAEGTALSPFESWLLLRGVQTLGVRLDRQQDSARRIARWLTDHPVVQRVHYVGLDAHPGAVINQRQARGPGCVISFETGDVECSRRLAEASRLFTIAVSFGGVHSSISLPCYMSHAPMIGDAARPDALPRDLVRLSIGIEDPDDLIDDLARAFDTVRNHASSAARSPCACAP